MNIKVVIRYWRTILVVAEMTMRQQLTDGFILFTVLFQPIIIAVLGLFMLQDKGADAAMFVVVGSGLTGLWSSLLFISGNSINSERWSGTLEALAAIPTPFEVVVFGKNLANVSQSLVSMVVGYLIAAYAFGYSLYVQQPGPFFVSVHPGGDRLHQLRPGHRADLRDEPRRKSLAERDGISCLHPVRVSLPDRHAARLDDAHLLAAATILGGGRPARDIHRRRADRTRLCLPGACCCSFR